jgi:hypothetical protein
MKLIRLTNGAWINPLSVKSIRPLPTEQGQRARVIVQHGENGHEIILSNDDEHAQEMADGIAAQINDALSSTSPELSQA